MKNNIELVWFKEIQNLNGRIIIDLVNCLNSEIGFSCKVAFKNLVIEKLDEKNEIVKLHVQTIDTTGENKKQWFEFTHKHATDFSCANINLLKLDVNPNIKERAKKWMSEHYDEGNNYEYSDMIHAFKSGVESVCKK